MKWRSILESVPVGLLLLVMASQTYNMARQFGLTYSPLMISRFTVDFQRCALQTDQVRAILSSGLRDYGSPTDGSDIMVSRLGAGELRIAMQLKEPGAAAFEKEVPLVKNLVDCGTSLWCQGKAPLQDYGEGQIAFVNRKRLGEQIEIPGCGITYAEFHPDGWELLKPSSNRFDALALIALVVEAASLYFLLRRPKRPAAASAK